MIVDELFLKVKDRAAKRKIVDVCIGIKYTAVLLDDGSCGLAATLVHQLPHRCECIKEIVNKTALEAAKMAFSPHLLPSVLGVATINALLSTKNKSEFTLGNILDFLPISREDTIGIVGAFLPLLPPLRKKTSKIYVFERYPINGVKEYYPDWAEPLLLSRCSIVIISGTTIINKTIDQVLSYLSPSQMIGMVGPTTPLAPSIFSKHKVSILSGVRVTNPGKLIGLIKQGGGTRDFQECTEKVNYFLKDLRRK